MREQKFLAGLGTILVFAGGYCFKALLQKPQNAHVADTVKKQNKLLLAIAGGVLIMLGAWLIVKAFASI